MITEDTMYYYITDSDDSCYVQRKHVLGATDDPIGPMEGVLIAVCKEAVSDRIKQEKTEEIMQFAVDNGTFYGSTYDFIERELAILKVLNNHDWVTDHITTRDNGRIFVAWDETGAYELGEFPSYEEAVSALIAYDVHLENERRRP